MAARGRDAHARDVALPGPAPRECVLHRSAAPHLRAPADAQTDARATRLVAVSRGRDRPATGGDGVCRDDRPASAGAAERRARLAQHGGGHAQAPARRTRHDATVERGGLVERAPTGWLFLTSTPETRPRLVPLTSLWLDTLVLRLMNQGQPRPRPTWFVLDELASLQRLPQLHTAITENRKSNNPVVLGFQGRSQLETRYGHDAEAMLSQPATKIFLRTSEPHAAKWIADTIGDIEIERLRESRSQGARRTAELRPGAPGRAAGDGQRNQRARGPARLSQDGQSRRPPELPVYRPAEEVARRSSNAPHAAQPADDRPRPASA